MSAAFDVSLLAGGAVDNRPATRTWSLAAMAQTLAPPTEDWPIRADVADEERRRVRFVEELGAGAPSDESKIGRRFTEMVERRLQRGEAPADARAAAGAQLAKEVRRDAKKELPAWSPARFPQGAIRNGANVLGVSALVFDFDSGDAIDTIWSLFDGHPRFLHTSWSHTAEHPKCRLVVPLAWPLPAEAWPRVWPWMVQYVESRGVRPDHACSNRDRLFFLPATPDASAPRESRACVEGPLFSLDWESLPDPEAERRQRIEDARRAQRELRPVYGDEDEDDRKRRFWGMVRARRDDLVGRPDGTRTPILRAAGVSLAKLLGLAGVPEGELFEALVEAGEAAGMSRDVPGLVRWCIAKGLEAPDTEWPADSAEWTARREERARRAREEFEVTDLDQFGMSDAPPPLTDAEVEALEGQGRTDRDEDFPSAETVSRSHDAGAGPRREAAPGQRERGIADFASSAAGWGPTPVPLPSAADLEVNPFPIDALPDPIKAMVEELARYMQVPIDLPGTLVLGVLAAACQGKVKVVGRFETAVALWVLVVLKSGERKTPTLNALTHPIYRWEAEQRKDQGPKRQEKIAKHKVAAKALDKALKARAEGKGTDEDVADAAKEFAENPEPAELVRMAVSDATPEALTMLMEQQGGRMAIVSDEANEVLSIAGGRYSEGRANIEALLKGWDGGRLTVDRVGRPGVFIARALLSMVLSIQPKPLEDLAERQGSFLGQGLFARFLWSIPKSMVGFREVAVTPMDPLIVAAYDRVMFRLLDLASVRGEDGCWEPKPIRLDEEAQAVCDAFAAEVELMLRSGGVLGEMPDWGNKLTGQAMRIACLFHCLERVPADPSGSLIGADDMEMAITLCRYFLSHARQAYGLMAAAETPEVAGAKRVLKWLKEHRYGRFTAKELFDGVRKSFDNTRANLDPVLELLESRRFIRREPQERKVGRPSVVYQCHPALSAEYAMSAKPRGRSGGADPNRVPNRVPGGGGVRETWDAR